MSYKVTKASVLFSLTIIFTTLHISSEKDEISFIPWSLAAIIDIGEVPFSLFLKHTVTTLISKVRSL